MNIFKKQIMDNLRGKQSILLAEIKSTSDLGTDQLEDILSLIIGCILATKEAGYCTYDGFELPLAGLLAQALEYGTIMHEDDENVPDGAMDSIKDQLSCNRRMLVEELKEYSDIGEERVESIFLAIIGSMREIKEAGYYPYDDFELSLAGLLAQALENGLIIHEDDVVDDDDDE